MNKMGKFLRLFMIFIVRKILNPLYEMAEFLGAIERVKIPDDMSEGEYAVIISKEAILSLQDFIDTDTLPENKKVALQKSINDLQGKIQELERQNLWDTDPREWYK